ncbi:hypothetical protein A3I58_02125 [Candidatus Peregrinibacteria bacterium RIFCSPLOWO2_02_FULL_39_10]|nr:MAG: hypothetical protein A3I58_02125 [Candidatus Peregrinibacteria bacterium RIFCSPLOWO2_02_FULL_39_10]
MFCDELKLKIIAGKGGNGSASFRREKYVPTGGPDGGDGGKGGSIIIKTNRNLNTLGNLANQKLYHAENGGNGLKKKMSGKNAEDLILEVPVGTMVFLGDKSMLISDMNSENLQATVAKGGKGGFGNTHFVSSTHQAPHFAETGEPGEEKEIILELKLVAEIGIIGLPSAGKSTLISIISNARPRIAAYPFTTLIPNLGVVNMSSFGGSKEDTFVVADMPGLIENASKGKGLGHQFLKHITRTKLLVHILDSYLEGLDKNYKIIRNELKNFDKELAKRDEIIVLNKIDILDENTLKNKIKELKKITKTRQIFSISGLTKKGLKPLMFEIFKKLKEIKREEAVKTLEKPTETIPVFKPHLDKVQFEIDKIIRKKDHKIFRITGRRIEQLILMTDIKNPEGLERIYHFIEKMGVRKTIEHYGATYGDIIKIKGKDIPYRK